MPAPRLPGKARLLSRDTVLVENLDLVATQDWATGLTARGKLP